MTCEHAAAGSEAALVGVTAAAASPAAPPRPPRVRSGAAPDLYALARSFAARGDGTAVAWGRAHRVTHPISSFGMEESWRRRETDEEEEEEA